MSRPGRRRAGIVAAFCVLLAVLSAAPPAYAATYEPITGSGSTWSQNALDQWRTNVASLYSMTVNYNGVGSTQGRREYINGDLDFAVSEIPFQSRPEDGSSPEAPPFGYAYMPIVAGGTAFMYHLDIAGKRVTNLRLSGANITKIFTGAITNWNDPGIQADNPGLAMPDKAIVPIVRSDGSGSSAQFTLWMSKQHGDLWTNGLRSQFPTPANGKAQKGSDGVSGYVAQGYGEGSITYVEYSYAIEAGFPVAKVLNAADYYAEPTANSVAVALLQAQINNDTASPDYLTQILDRVYNNSDPRTYPLSSYSYMIVPTELGGKTFTTAKGSTLSVFASYMLCEGQQQAADLGYSPLPMNLVLAGFEQIKRIPGNTANTDPNMCRNPTFKPGDSPNSNQLALTALQPADCDKRGPNQCTTGTAGAPQETAVTGTASTTNTAAAGASGASAEAEAAAAAAAGGELSAADTAAAAAGGSAPAVYDSEGNLISGTAGAVASAAVASPFTLDESAWGWQQSVMLGAVILLIAVVALPPALASRVRRKARP